MPSFKNFANGRIENWNSSEFTSIRHKQIQDTKVGSRIEKVWATDFERCKSREDFEKYISKYSKYDSNKYVEQAKAKIESFDSVENTRVEMEKAAQRVQQRSVTYGTGGSAPSQNKILQTCAKAFVWIIIIGGVVFYSYNQYKQDTEVNTTDGVVTPQSSQHQDPQEEYATDIHSEQTNKQENSVIETGPQEYWWDCTCCGTTGRCQLCFGSGRCAVCGGGRQVFSCFDGNDVVSGRMADCGNCGGSGYCPACEGTGACSACHGRGKCKLEE